MIPFDDVVEVSNYIGALERGMARLREGFPLSNRLFEKCTRFSCLAGGVVTSCRASFAGTQNWLGGTRPGNARFVPPPPQEVERCMAALESFLHQEKAVYRFSSRLRWPMSSSRPSIRSSMGMVVLVGCFIALVLHHGGLLAQPLLYLSLYLKEHRQVYYDLLDGVRTAGDWEAWVDFFLEGVEETARGAVQTARRLIDLFETDSRRVQQTGRAAPNALRVLAALRERPVLTLKHLRDAHKMTFPTAGKAMQSLLKTGIARELTGQRRNRVFVYDAYLSILNEGSEPL